jgi:hypothetical protein
MFLELALELTFLWRHEVGVAFGADAHGFPPVGFSNRHFKYFLAGPVEGGGYLGGYS